MPMHQRISTLKVLKFSKERVLYTEETQSCLVKETNPRLKLSKKNPPRRSPSTPGSMKRPRLSKQLYTLTHYVYSRVYIETDQFKLSTGSVANLTEEMLDI